MPKRYETKKSMTRSLFLERYVAGAISLLVAVVVFIMPFVFIVLMAAKSAPEASKKEFSLPSEWHLVENFLDVMSARDFMLPRAFANSAILTVASVALMVLLSAAAAYVLHRRRSRWNKVVNFFVLAGLIVPPAVVPTIWVLQTLGIFKTMGSMILIEATFGLSFSILMLRAFVSTIPRELDEAATLDGAGPIRLFFAVILPLLKPALVTLALVQSVWVFNDFNGPLYFLPGDANATVQLTLYNFQSSAVGAVNQWNLVFMNILLITIPLLIVYAIFNKQIVAGMTSGAVKG